MQDIPAGDPRPPPPSEHIPEETPQGPSAGRARSELWHRSLRIAAMLALGAMAALAGMWLVPAAEVHLGEFSVASSARLGKPATTLEIPPVGAISARTHEAPLSVTLSVTRVDPQAVAERISAVPDGESLVVELTVAIERVASALALRVMLGGAVLGGLALALLPGRRWLSIVAGTLGGLVASGTMLLLTWSSFQPDAFRNPTFTGSLERAPQVIRAIQEQSFTIDEARSRVRGAAVRLSRALTLLGQPVGDPSADSVAVLHIGDVHSNPLGLEFARELAGQFGVDAVLDTGDLTSFGDPVEARIGQLVSQMGVPYLYVPGNHDSPPIREAIAALPNVVMLDGQVSEVRGVRIQGFADPAFTASGEVSNEEHERAVRAAAGSVAGAVEREEPDVLAVHHPRLAARSFGRVPLILAGHRHREGSTSREGTLLLEVGSTGATGLGSFLAEADMAYEAQIVYFRDGRPTAYDYVRFHGLGNDFEIQRRTLGAQAEGEGSPPPPGPPPEAEASPTG